MPVPLTPSGRTGLGKTPDIDQVLVLSGDHVYKMDYQQMLSYHRAKNADLTISAIRVKKEAAAGRLGVFEVDNENRMVVLKRNRQYQDHCRLSDQVFGSMASISLTQMPARCAPGKEEDFGKNIIPRIVKEGSKKVYIYDFEKDNRIETMWS